MKKVLALVLAVMMLSTFAFAESITDGTGTADSYGTLNPGMKIKMIRGTSTGDDPSDNSVIFVDQYGVTGTATYEDVTYRLLKELNSDNYKLSKRITKGKDLIEDIYFDDDEDQLVVELVQDFENAGSKSFEVEIDLRGIGRYTLNAEEAGWAGKTEGDKINVPDVEITLKGTVGYDKAYLVMKETGDDMDIPADLTTDKDGNVAIAGDLEDYVIEVIDDDDAAYVNMVQDIGGDVEMNVRVYDGDEFYLGTSTKANTDVLKANADSDAELSFYKWDGNPTFNSTATVYFYEADEDSYVYEIKNGKLTEVGEYDDDEGCWVLKTRTLGEYVVSDTELVNAKGETTEPEVTNPDTGANDVVGIAAALGVVALVSAAAVSLKK